MTTTTAASQRDIARNRAAQLLSIPPKEVEDDLLDFITHGHGDAVLRARAGSGKTTALALKVAYLTIDLGVRPSSIVLLAFNNAAARSIESRLGAFNVPPGVRVRTFHAYAARIVRAHFGAARRPVFDEQSEEGLLIARLMDEALDEVVNEKFYGFCASRMRTSYRKRRDYVESVGREALLSATQFMRARGYGLQNRLPNAWEEIGPIAGNAMRVAVKFETKLREARLLDATGVIQAAGWTLERELEKGVMRESEAHDVDWIFVDEAQDVSMPYMRLVKAVREINGGANIQMVGDDWQAINGFAGSDTSFFLEPDAHLEDPEVMFLLKNRRSGAQIVDWGNGVMRVAGYTDAPAVPHKANGKGAVKTARVSAKRDLRLAAQKLAELIDKDATSVALIARKWKVGNHGLSRLRGLVETFAKDAGKKCKVIGITAHGSKGLEWQQILLLDDGSFPNEHPSRPILEDLIPEHEFLREEACLKHVAGTRAQKTLTVVNMV